MASYSEVIVEAFDLVKKNYLKFLFLYLIIYLFTVVILFLFVLTLFLTGAFNATNLAAVVPSILVFIGLLVLIVFFVEPIWLGAYYSMALQGLRGGISLRYAFSQTFKKYKALFSTFAIESVILLVIDVVIFSPLLVALPGFLTTFGSYVSGTAPNLTPSFLSTPAGGALLSFLALLLVVMAIYVCATAILVPLFFEAVPLVMIEGTKGINAIKESIGIGRKLFLTILALIIIFTLILFAVEFVQGLLIDVVKLINAVAGSIISIILSVLVSAFITGWSNALPVIFYRDYLKKKTKSKSRK